MPAVLTVQQYVAASAQVGYRHPDLTLHAGQLQDWYRSEDGIDLDALLHDCGALEAAASAADEAIHAQDRQRAALPEAWQGAGAAASAEFLRRHSDASATVAAALHTAREAMEMLREQLWEAVDNKVGAVIEIEGRAATTRTEWSAAAATVTSGVGDRAAASELVDQAVKPFVDSTIRIDWLAAMRSAVSSVTNAYRRATEDIAGLRLPDFAIPGDLGPAWTAPAAPPGEVASMPAPAPVVGSAGGVMPAPAPATVPAAWSAPTPTTPSAPAEMPSAPAAAAPPVTPSMGSAGPALPGLGGGGGLSGLGQPFADALSGLLGGGGGLPDPPPLDVPELDDPADTVELEDEEADEDEAADEDLADDAGDADEDEEADTEGDPAVADEDPAEAPDEKPAGEPMPAPTPPPPPPPAEPLPPVAEAEAEVDERTPCQIAADELPQVGESLPSEPGGG
ncbi:hypothetical protein MPOR_17270 [Mycolicibacterium poriferae]|uniref:Uncharacterized protein n=2 Tax=Mycolicibacterium poriferae TaxID=39694 RepID=A0A6N4V7V8_9MYCO|nr:hypothetical protein MPOR_17270 [Mycolicibacterium poriferae]